MKRTLFFLALMLVAIFSVARWEMPKSSVDAKGTLVSGLTEQPRSMAQAILGKKDTASVSVSKKAEAGETPVADNEPDWRVSGGMQSYFPKAKVISSETKPGPKPGQTTVLKTVETSMAQPYVSIEETHELRNGKSVVTGQKAMVSNQLLLRMPPNANFETFSAGLKQAGATDTKRVGEAVLATFPAQPDDPHALDGFMQSVRQVMGNDVMVEPNYVRKMVT